MNSKNIFFRMVCLLFIGIFFSCNDPVKNENIEVIVDSPQTTSVVTATPTPTPTPAPEPLPAAAGKPADKNALIGNWERTDAPYQIKVAAIKNDGNITAGYFNPKSINVDKAMWNNENGLLKMYIELRDENYPGSNYKLNYDAAQDVLSGEYFQAVEGNTYNVAFKRVK